MPRKQSGFGIEGLLAVIFVLGVITILGIYFLKKSDENRSTNSTGTKTYSNKTFDFSFEYPAYYKVDEIMDTDNALHLQLVPSGGRPAVGMSAASISYEKDAYDSVGSILNGTHKRHKSAYTKQVKLIIDGMPAVEYEFQDGSFYRGIQIDTPQNTYSFALNVSKGMLEEDVEMLRTIAKSFRLDK